MSTFKFHCGKEGCTKFFYTMGKLRRHNNTHTKPFLCETCARGFALRADLRRHIKANHRLGHGKYACRVEGCTFAGTRKDNVRNHEKKAHGNLQAIPQPTTLEHPMEISDDHKTATSGSLALVEAAIDSGIDINIVNDDKLTALHCAARAGQSTIVRFLLENGADRCYRSQKGRLPLHESILSRDLETVKLLLPTQGTATIAGDLWRTSDCLARSESIDILDLRLSRVESGILGRFKRAILLASSEHGVATMVDAILSHPSEAADHHIGMEHHHESCSNEPELWWASAKRKTFSALHLAARFGRVEVTRVLIQRQFKANIEGRVGITPLHVASREGHASIAEILLEQAEININCKATGGNFSYFTPLHFAAKHGHAQVTQLLLRHPDIDINSSDSHQRSPLSLATSSGHLEVVEILLRQTNIDINSCDSNQRSPLHLAAASGHLEVVEFLLRQTNIDINSCDLRQRSPLHLAASSGHLEVVEFLLRQTNIDVSSRDRSSQSAIHYAAFSGHWDIVQVLLDHEKSDKTFELPKKTLQLSPATPTLIVKRLLLHRDFLDVNFMFHQWKYSYRRPQEGGMLHVAARQNECDVLRFLLGQQGINVNLQDPNYSKTPLFVAVENGHEDAAQLLLKHENIDVNLASDWGGTPLQVARKRGFQDLVDLLLAHGAVDPEPTGPASAHTEDTGLSSSSVGSQAEHVEGDLETQPYSFLDEYTDFTSEQAMDGPDMFESTESSWLGMVLRNDETG